MAKLRERIKKAWNIFTGKESPSDSAYLGPVTYRRIDHMRPFRHNERSIVTAVYNRIAIDAAVIKMVHAQQDANERYAGTITSGLNDVLSLDANIDQTGFAFKLDLFMSLCDEGEIAIVPTFIDDEEESAKGITACRIGKVVQWFPKHVRVSLYNEDTGRREEITLPKDFVGLVENPFYSIMNEPNSTASRLIRKLQLLDAIDQQLGSGKLDLIIQLPYALKGAARLEQAERRRGEIEHQLKDTKYGIAYIDGTEKIVQLNRPIENNLMSQVEYLEKSLYSQLSITEEILNGTANEQTMINYYNRTIEPLIQAVADEMTRKFLDKEARDEGESIMFFRDPFKLVPVAQLAEIADKLTRNEIASSNEIRTIIGWKPSDQPQADELRNANLNHPDEQMLYPDEMDQETVEE